MVKRLLLAVVLVSVLASLAEWNVPETQAQEDTLIQSLTTLVDTKINWADPTDSNWWHQDVNTKLKAYVFNKISKTELESYLASLTLPAKILYGYAQVQKYGIENEAKIKEALDGMGMMSNGLPWNLSDANGKYFRVIDRYMLYGYYWAEKFNYQTAKWDRDKAYDNFKWALDNSSCPAALYIYEDNDTYVLFGDTEARYYDETMETLDCYLYFYELGISEALDAAINVWNWCNNYNWNVDHYNYRPSDSGYECESGGFLQVALKLQYYAGAIENITRITADMLRRYISNKWLSPQWSYDGTSYYAVVHKNPNNPQRRMQNTLMAWASIYGNYYNLTEAERANVTDLIKGYGGLDPAWELLYDSGLYNAISGKFRELSDSVDRNHATGDAAILLMLLGIIPDTGTLAMPLTEMIYEDVCNLIDKDILSINIPTRTLRISIQKVGTIKFQYGSEIPSYNFTQSGCYDVVFSSDWNTITSVTRAGDLPSNRKYFTENFGKQYTFYGAYNENTGQLSGAATVTAYYTADFYPETFEVEGSYTFCTLLQPLYFYINFGTSHREYWLSPKEDSGTIYLFNETLTTYTVSFLDLAGILSEYSYVEAKRWINGFLRTVEKKKVDEENKVIFNLVQNTRYTITVGNGETYTFGDVTFASVTSISLTLRGIDFPKETLLTYKYVRIYGDRALGDPNGTITITYQDTLNETNSVTIYINYKNGTNVYNAIETSDSFSHTWASALNDTDYAVVCTINHQRYGTYMWKQYFPRSFSEAPWGLDWMGKLPFDTSILLPAFFILCAFGCFSVLNAYIGAFTGTVTAILLSYMGWINIPAATLVVALTFTVLIALGMIKRRVET